MIYISPFTPLFFTPTTDKFGAKSKYVQTFSSTDRIFIELISEGESDTPEVVIRNLVDNKATPMVLSSWQMNPQKAIYFYTVFSLPVGYYDIVINGSESEMFKVTDDESELAETTLIQFSMKDNRQRADCVWWIDGMQYFFDFRVPGGFKDEGWGFGVDNEQFVTADEDIVELYSHEHTTNIFTLGNAIGCPVWYAELLNRILCCNYVYFNGVRYARKESSVPELNQQVEGLKSFVFNQMLQKVRTMNPDIEWTNQVSIRRTQEISYRSTTDGDIRSIKSGKESGEKITIVNGKLYMVETESTSGGIQHKTYDCRIILDSPASCDVVFDIPVISYNTSIMSTRPLTILSGALLGDTNFSLYIQIINLDAGIPLKYNEANNDSGYYYTVDWDGKYVEALPELGE